MSCLKLREKKRISESQIPLFSSRIGKFASAALKAEAWTAPKPGLVDRFDSGAHSDMDLDLFLKSAAILEPFFTRMAAAGFAAALEGATPPDAFLRARLKGIEAEKAMFQATSGINTHKGAIFSLGLVATAAGYLHAHIDEQFEGCPPQSPAADGQILHLLDCASAMVGGIVQNELQRFDSSGNLGPMTEGRRLYRTYGLTGIRGEAESGFPSIKYFGLPALREILSRPATGIPASRDAIALHVLLTLMCATEDTNIASRGGLSGLNYVRESADAFLNTGSVYSATALQKLRRMNADFTRFNLSPGGSADLTALTLFLASLFIKEDLHLI